jgi:hypothetical protein
MAYIDKSLTLPEVFKRVSEKETIEEKAKALKSYETKSLRWFIDSLYNRDLSDIVIPEYKVSKNPSGIAFMNINNSINRIEAAISNKDKPWIVNRNFTLVLEGVTSEEASLIEKLLKGERRITGVSKTVFKKAYPEFFRTEEEVQ